VDIAPEHILKQTVQVSRRLVCMYTRGSHGWSAEVDASDMPTSGGAILHSCHIALCATGDGTWSASLLCCRLVVECDVCCGPALQTLTTILKKPGVRKKPFLVRTVDDVLLCARNMNTDSLAPIFLTSAVTGR
jgi:hypothetical protein